MATATKEPKKAKTKEVTPPQAEGLAAICQRAELLAAVEFCGAAVNQRSPNKVLIGLHIMAEKNKLRLRGTNLEAWLAMDVTAVQIEGQGEAVIPAEMLRDVLRKMPDETVRLTATADEARITGNDADIRLFTLDAKAFPADPVGNEPITFGVPLVRVKQMLARVIFAVAKNNSRYAFNGLLWEARGGKLTTAATNGRCLHLDIADVPKKAEASAIVPADSIRHILRLEGEEGEELAVSLSPSFASFECGSTFIGTNLLEGSFPPYDDIVPRDSSRKITVGRDAMLSAMAQAMTMVTEDSKGAKFAITKDRIVISCRNVGAGSSTVNVACKTEGEPIEIGLHPAFFTDAIREAGETITMEMTEPNRPTKITDGSPYVAIVMPVNLL